MTARSLRTSCVFRLFLPAADPGFWVRVDLLAPVEDSSGSAAERGLRRPQGNTVVWLHTGTESTFGLWGRMSLHGILKQGDM